MGKSLAEYAAEQGQQEQPAEDRQIMAAVAADAEDRAADAEEVQRLKDSIAQQLQTGTEPQYILYAALKCIGIATHDADWTAAGQAQLDTVYADLAQQSFITDNAAIADRRLKEQTEAYNEKLRRQLQQLIKGYQKIARGLNDTLADLDAIEGKDKRLDWTDTIEED